MASADKLHALTSLRFFAALAIVVHHTKGHLGVDVDFAKPFLFEQGVSFFFVLSGFILSHVHGDLAKNRTARFLWARFARIWPGHIAATVFVGLLIGWPAAGFLPQSLPAMLANLTLLHAWLPWPSYYYSLNNVSWTLSVEFFFYVTFPVLIHRFERRWPFWLALSLIAAWALTEVAGRYDAEGFEANRPTIASFVYIHPLARWFEFVLGVATACAWRRGRQRVRLAPAAGTLLEIAAVGAVLAATYSSSALSARLADDTARYLWLVHGPVAAPAFALLIAVMALERGAVSRVLGHAVFVRLGEISYALYLIHYSLLTLAWLKFPDAASGPGLLLLLAQILLASHLLWQCVEAPARRYLTRRFPMSPGAAPVALFPVEERRTLWWTAGAHGIALVSLFAAQKWWFEN